MNFDDNMPPIAPRANVPEPTAGLNPYASPYAAQFVRPAVETSHQLPAYCKTMAIMDIVWCALRVPIVAFGLIGWAALRQAGDNPMLITVPFEIATGTALAAFGLAAAICMLRMKRIAVFLGVLAILATLASVAVGLWQVSLQFDQMPPPGPERTGFYIGAIGAIVIRVTLLVLYAIAVYKYDIWIKDVEWSNRREQQARGAW